MAKNKSNKNNGIFGYQITEEAKAWLPCTIKEAREEVVAIANAIIDGCNEAKEGFVTTSLSRSIRRCVAERYIIEATASTKDQRPYSEKAVVETAKKDLEELFQGRVDFFNKSSALSSNCADFISTIDRLIKYGLNNMSRETAAARITEYKAVKAELAEALNKAKVEKEAARDTLFSFYGFDVAKSYASQVQKMDKKGFQVVLDSFKEAQQEVKFGVEKLQKVGEYLKALEARIELIDKKETEGAWTSFVNEVASYVSRRDELNNIVADALTAAKAERKEQIQRLRAEKLTRRTARLAAETKAKKKGGDRTKTAATPTRSMAEVNRAKATVAMAIVSGIDTACHMAEVGEFTNIDIIRANVEALISKTDVDDDIKAWGMQYLDKLIKLIGDFNKFAKRANGGIKRAAKVAERKLKGIESMRTSLLALCKNTDFNYKIDVLKCVEDAEGQKDVVISNEYIDFRIPNYVGASKDLNTVVDIFQDVDPVALETRAKELEEQYARVDAKFEAEYKANPCFAKKEVEYSDLDMEFKFYEHLINVGDIVEVTSPEEQEVADAIRDNAILAAKMNNKFRNEVFNMFVVYCLSDKYNEVFQFPEGYSEKLMEAVEVKVRDNADKGVFVDEFTSVVQRRLRHRKIAIKNDAHFYITNVVLNAQDNRDEDGNPVPILNEDVEYGINVIRNMSNALMRNNGLSFFKDGQVVIGGKTYEYHCKDLIQLTLSRSNYNIIVDEFNRVAAGSTSTSEKIEKIKKNSQYFLLYVAIVNGKQYMHFKDSNRIFTEDGLLTKEEIAKVNWSEAEKYTYMLGAASPSGQRLGKLLYFLVAEGDSDICLGMDRWNKVFNEKTNGGLKFGKGLVPVTDFIKKTVRALAPYAPSTPVGNISSFALFNGENGLQDGAAALSHLFSKRIKQGDGVQGRVVNAKCHFITEDMRAKLLAHSQANYKFVPIDMYGEPEDANNLIPSGKNTDGKIYIVYDSSIDYEHTMTLGKFVDESDKEYWSVLSGMALRNAKLDNIETVKVPVPDIFTDRNGMKLVPDGRNLGTDLYKFNMLDMAKPSDFEDGSNTSLTIFTQLAYACGKEQAAKIVNTLTREAVVEKMAAKMSTDMSKLDVVDPDAYRDIRDMTPGITFCYDTLYRRLIENMKKEIVNAVKQMHFAIKGAYCRATAEIAWSWFSEEGQKAIKVGDRSSFNPTPVVESKIIYENESYVPHIANKYKEMDQTIPCVKYRMAVGEKYPTMGVRENFLFHALDLDEIRGRLVDSVSDEADFVSSYLSNWYEKLGDCVIVMPASTMRMDMLAGMDYDYDGLTIVTDPRIVEQFYNYAKRTSGKERMVTIDKSGIKKGDTKDMQVENSFSSMCYTTILYALANAQEYPSKEEKAREFVKDFIEASAKSIGQITNYNVTNNIWLIEARSLMSKIAKSDEEKELLIARKKAYMNEAIKHMSGTPKKRSPLAKAHNFATSKLEYTLEFEKAEYEDISCGLVPYYGVGTPVDVEGRKVDPETFEGPIFYKLIVENHVVDMAKDDDMFEKMATCCWSVEEAKTLIEAGRIEAMTDEELTDIVMNNYINMLEELNDWYRGYQETQIDSAKTGVQKKVVCIFSADTAMSCGVRENKKGRDKQIKDFFYNETEKTVEIVEKTCDALMADRGEIQNSFGLKNGSKTANQFANGFNINKYYERIAMVLDKAGDIMYADDNSKKNISIASKCYGAVAYRFSNALQELEEREENGEEVEDEIKSLRRCFKDDSLLLRDDLIREFTRIAEENPEVSEREIAAEIGLLCEYMSNFTLGGEEKERATKFFWNVGAEFYLVHDALNFGNASATVPVNMLAPTDEVETQLVSIQGQNLVTPWGEVVAVLPYEAGYNDGEEFALVSYGNRGKLICNTSITGMMLLANNEISSDDVRFTCFDHMKGIKLEVGQILVVEDGYAQFDDVLMLEAKTVLPDGNYMITEIVSTENNRYVVKVSEV